MCPEWAERKASEENVEKVTGWASRSAGREVLNQS